MVASTRMTPELLQTLTAAKGLPLPEESAVHFDRVGYLFTKDKRLQLEARRLHKLGEIPTEGGSALASYLGQTAIAKQPRSMRASQWSLVECGLACHGMDATYYDAIRYQFALDMSVYWRVYRRLWDWASVRREVERWPMVVIDQEGKQIRYLMDLIHMRLAETFRPSIFQCPMKDIEPRQIVMNVGPLLWQRRLSPIYEAIGDEFLVWLAIGTSHMWRWLRDDEE
jgi:hypothetical protein